MAEPKVSILLTMVDKLSAPIQGVRGQLKAWENDFKSLGSQATELLNNKLVQGIGLYGLVNQLGKAFDASDQFVVSLQKLSGTAKITGVSIDTLNEIAAEAEQRFGLSKIQAADFAVEMAKLAAKAGDVGKAGPALQSFLDIGAARGLTAEQTLTAVRQAILGIDEGTDKLFNANPSVLYQRFADAIGISVGKLTDQQKAQALLNAAMEDGSKVQGQYVAWLGTTAGQLQLAKNRTQEAYAAIGAALSSTRSALADAMAWLANGVQAFVGGLQLIGNDVGYFFAMLPTAFRNAWETLMVAVGSGVERLGKVLPFVGDKIEEVGAKLKATHQKNLDDARAYLVNLETAHEEAANEIVGIATNSETRQTAALTKGIATRATTAASGHTAAAKDAKASHAALETLQDEAFKSQVTLLTEQQREWEEVKRKFADKMQDMTAEDYAEAKRLLDQVHRDLLMKWAGFNDKLEAVVQDTTEVALKPLTTDFPQAVDTKVNPATKSAKEKFYDLMQAAGAVGAEISSAAQSVLKFTDAIGFTNPDIEKMVGNIGQLGEGIKGISAALTGPDGVNVAGLMGGIAAGIAGLQGIVGALFGDSPAERARKQLLYDNTVALDKLRERVGDLYEASLPGAKIKSFQGINVEDLISSTHGPSNSPLGNRVLPHLLGQYLMAHGLSMSDFQQIAKDLGIDLGDGTNGYDADVVRQVFAGIASYEPNQFDQSFSGQQDFLSGYFNVAGIDDPALQAEFIKGSLKGKNDFLYNLLSKYNLADPADRAKLREELAGIYQSLNNGTFDVGNFGSMTGKEFANFIESFAGLLGRIDTGATSGGTGTATSTPEATVTGSFTTSSVSGGVDAAVFDAIRDNTALGAANTARIVELLESGALGTTNIYSGGSTATVDALDAMLQASRDLYDVSQGNV